MGISARHFERFMAFLESQVGTPYIWAGDDPIAGFDCSGLVVEAFKIIGILKDYEDLAAEDMLQKWADKIVKRPERGCLVFRLNAQHQATHIGVCLDSEFFIAAEGGTSKTITQKDAIDQNAFVRVRPIYDKFSDPVFVDIWQITL